MPSTNLDGALNAVSAPDAEMDSPRQSVAIPTAPSRAASAVSLVANPISASAAGELITAEPVNDLPPDTTEGWKRRKGQSLNSAELRIMLLMAAEGRTQEDIAAALRCTQGTISKNLSAWQDTRIEAKAVIGRSARKIAEKLVESKDDATLLELLDRDGVLEKKRDDTGSSKVQVLIGVQMPVSKSS